MDDEQGSKRKTVGTVGQEASPVRQRSLLAWISADLKTELLAVCYCIAVRACQECGPEWGPFAGVVLVCFAEECGKSSQGRD